MRRPRVAAFALACLVAAGWLVTVGVWLGTSLTRDHRGVAKEQRSRAARALYATKYHPPEEDDQSMV